MTNEEQDVSRATVQDFLRHALTHGWNLDDLHDELETAQEDLDEEEGA